MSDKSLFWELSEFCWCIAPLLDHFQIPADKKSVQNDKKLADKICGNICNVLLNMADDADKDLNNNCKCLLPHKYNFLLSGRAIHLTIF